MKKFIASSVTAATVLFGQSAIAGDSASDLQQQLQQMQEQLKQQQEQINQLEGKAGQEFVTRDEARRLIQNEMTVMVDERVEQGMAQMRDSSPILTLGPNIDGLDIRGDLTFRWVRVERDTDTSTGFSNVGTAANPNYVGTGANNSDDRSEDSFGVRLSLGGVWKSEGWEIGIGLTLNATNDSNSLTNNSASSTNVFNTYGESGVFGSDNIDLDYAYAKHTWGDLSLTIGQQHNPFRSTWILWDDDIRPIGVTAQYVYQDFFFTVGGYDVRHYGRDEGEGYLIAGQAGVDTSYDQLDVVAAVAWYYFNEQATDSNTTAASPVLGPTSAGLGNDSQFNLLDLYLNLTYNFQDEVTLGLYGEYVHNFGAEGESGNSQVGMLAGGEDPEDNNQAWIVGGNIGWRGVTVDYGYAHIESDAVPASINDDEFGSSLGNLSTGTNHQGVNVEGHKLSVSYAVSENITVTGTAFWAETLETAFNGSAVAEGDESRYQLDVKYIF